MLFITPAILVLLSIAVLRDVATRTIPDEVSIALAVLGLGLRWIEGWHAALLSLGVAVLIFSVLLICHARSAIGGGDVKLLTALVLGLSPLDSYQLIGATALAGGVLGLGYLSLSRLLARTRLPVLRPHRSLLRRIAVVELRRIRRRAPLPYGVAIAIGAAFVLLNTQGG